MDGRREAVVLAVMKRAGGLLLALPRSFLSEEELSDMDAPDSLLGPSVALTLPGLVLVDGQELNSGVDADVLVVDADQEICRFIRPYVLAGESIAEPFFPDDPFAFPAAGELLAKTMGWLQSFNQGDWYANVVTAESAPQTPIQKTSKQRRPKAQPGGATSSGGEKPKITAALASSVQTVVEALPVLTNQLQTLVDRQSYLEEQLGQGF